MSKDRAEPSGISDLPPLTARVLGAIAEIDAAQWDACANPGDGVPMDPFLSHAFLRAIEESGSATARTGWAPQHLVLEQAGRVLGVAPLYLKSHSYGEYVFDQGWARAYEQAGGRYYPKLQIAVPFTPVTGRRLLVRPGPQAAQIRRALVAAALELARQRNVSSLHVTFPSEAEWEELGGLGFLQRTDQQFHWENKNYSSFDDFLNALSSRKRKQIRKERREALAPGISCEVLTGSDLREEHWDAFFTFYRSTGARKWGSPYLTRDFFSRIGAAMPERIALVLCRRAGRYIAGALNFIGSDTLYGRNWGAVEDHPFLHFEACYYQAIDFAIARGLKRVEAGAQGPHKLARGYLPCLTYSAHWLRDPVFRDAVARYLEQERDYVAEDRAFLEEHTPFRRGPLTAEDDDEAFPHAQEP